MQQNRGRAEAIRGQLSFQVVPLRHEWLSDLSRIHSDSLPGDFLPSLGESFLKDLYYPSVFQSRNAITLVALIDDCPVGFVTVSNNSRALTREVVSGNYLRLSLYAFAAAIAHWGKMKQCCEVIWSALLAKPDRIKSEIVFIAVSEEYRNRGIGTALVNEALRWLKKKEALPCRTKTRADNARVIAMYQRMGWRIRERFVS